MILSAVLTIVAGCLLVVSVVAFIGWRKGAGPHCRKCNYALAGIDTKHPCPECGCDLANPRAIRKGSKTRRGKIALFTFLVALLSCASAAYLGLAQSPRWNAYKPTWLLMYEAKNSSTQTATAAMGVLVKRAVAGDIRPERFVPLVDRAMKEYSTTASYESAEYVVFLESVLGQSTGNQSQPQTPPPTQPKLSLVSQRIDPWVAMLAVLRVHGMLDEQHMVQALNEAFSRAIFSDQPVQQRRVSSRVGLLTFDRDDAVKLILGRVEFSARLTEVRCGDVAVDVGIAAEQIPPNTVFEYTRITSSGSGIRLNSTREINYQALRNDAIDRAADSLRPGAYQIELEYALDILTPQLSQDALSGIPSTLTLTRPLTIHATSVSELEMVTSEDGVPSPDIHVDSRVRGVASGATNDVGVHVTDVRSSNEAVVEYCLRFENEGQLNSVWADMAVGGTVALRVGDVELIMFERFGYDDTPQCVVLHQGVLSAYTGAIRGLPQGTRKVDFVIKPDPQVVFDRVDFPRVWNEEVVIRDVPVFWPPGIGTDK